MNRAVAALGVLALSAPAAAQPSVCRIDVVEATVPQLQAAMARGDANSVGLVDAYLARIAAYDRHGPKLNAIIRLNPRARAEAAALDRERRAGHVRGPMHGIPVLLKDNYDTYDIPTTGGSVALAGFVPSRDATVVARLRKAGAVILGKTNLHELAIGVTTISSFGGQTLNPYDPERIPGGSSGGSAVASTSSLAAVTYGSDTCGSLRVPAAFTSLFALRPTWGLIETDGIIPLSHSQDVVGPMARSVTDLAIGLDAIVATPSFVAALDTASLRGARLGVIKDSIIPPEDAEGAKLIAGAMSTLRAHGAEIVDVKFPVADSVLGQASVIDFEFKWDLEDFLAREPNAPVRSVADLLGHGLYASAVEGRLRHRDSTGTRDSPAYKTALAQRTAIRNTILGLLDAQHLDAIVYPTARRGAPRVGDPLPIGGSCLISAVTGLPAIAAPAGLTAKGLPIGFEMLGRPNADTRLVSLAYGYEQAAHPRRRPPTTPALVNGHPPGPVLFVATTTGAGGARATARFLVDSANRTVRYHLSVRGRAYGTMLSAIAPNGSRRVVDRLSRPEETRASGQLAMSIEEEADLFNGRIGLMLLSADDPLGSAPAPLVRRRSHP
jgi:amidase